MDSTNPHTKPSNFVDLLNRQQDTPFPYASFPLDGDIGSSQLPLFSTQATATSSFYEDSPTQHGEAEAEVVGEGVHVRELSGLDDFEIEVAVE
ncbi:hypothetical protein F2Q70_00033529 [Brassica cretica]|uniref:Uncharacterized protein n=1 Tax=Brassica cretica TaxID=69181 RepID=A0A8S9FDG1_BRACR|nr:hypothetical protein F2Q70_00033529 [Brassica cretica]